MQNSPGSSLDTRLLSIMGLVALLVGFVVMLLLPEIRLAAWGIMGLGVILLLVALVLDFRRVSAALTGRRGRFGAGTTLMAAIFLGITVLINGISVTAFRRLDTTSLGQFTLTEQTKDVLRDLDKPVKALCFFVAEKDQYGITAYAASLLAEYQNYTARGRRQLLTVETIDPDEHPDRARRYGIFQYQTVVFESGDRRRQVLPSQIIQFSSSGVAETVEAEHAFTGAILEVTGVVQKRIYFLTGHGEADLGGKYSRVYKGLRDDLYQVDTLNLMTDPKVPDDTAVLIIAGPKSPLTSPEIEVINRYLYAGGQLLILTDPGFPEGLNEIVSPWGVQLADGTVVDRASAVAPRKDMPLVSSSRNFFSGLGVSITSYFPGAVGIVPVEKETVWPPLVYSSGDSWLEKDFDPAKEPVFDEGRDVKGPVAIGVVIAASLTEGQKKLTRMIIIGDSDFAANEHYSQVNNSDLFLNAVSWLAEETELIKIRRAASPFRRLAVTRNEANFITYSSLALPPVLVLLIGGIIWWYRRS